MHETVKRIGGTSSTAKNVYEEWAGSPEYQRLNIQSGPFKGKPQQWFTRKEVIRLLSPIIDCIGTSPCSTCPDIRECGKAGCIRIAARRNATGADAGSPAR